MAEDEGSPETPDWDALFEIAQSQAGYFTTKQAACAGYSPQLLSHHLDRRIERVRRGVYRLVHFPASDHEDLVVLWLWSEQEGVFSHATALALHDFSDILPSRVHLTLPVKWRRRRLRLPTGLVVHFADLDERDRSSFDAIPVTGPRRTLMDCIATNLEPRLVEQAVRQARQRGLISEADEARFRSELSGVGEGTPP